MGIVRMKPLIAGLLIYLLIGLIYAWSIFVAPLEAEFGWSRAQTSATFTISMIFFCAGGIASGIISRKKSARFIIIIAAVFLFVGFCASSRVESVVGLYITYGVLCGTGVGLAYNADISAVIKWFPDKAGLVSGLLLMCFGCGGMILGSVASALIESMGWRITFIILGILFAVILLIASIWIREPPEGTILPQSKIKKKENREKGIDMVAGKMIKRPAFWLHFIWTTILSAAGLAVIGHASVCAQDMGATVTFATLITGCISICNGGGRILAGLIFDNLGRKISVRWGNITMVIAFTLLVYSVISQALWVFVIAAFILGIAYGSLPPINSAFVNLFYGSKNYALNFSFMNSNLIPASLLGPLVAGVVKTATGSYTAVFVLLLVLSILSALLQLGVKRP